MHIIIRVDGGEQIGYGHLIRSNALCRDLIAKNCSITVATTTPHSVKSVFPKITNVVELSSRDDPQSFVEWIERIDPDAVFTDAYPIDTTYQQAIREHVPIAVLQDDDRHAISADVFINGNLYADELDYDFVGTPPKTCLGTKYVLLREEIRERAAKEVPWREVPERAVIMMGGSDVADLTPVVLRAFDGFELHVDVIIGPGCTGEQEQTARNVAKECSISADVARDPDDLVERMAQADLAVSTASTTTYELLALGTPIVSIAVVDNQSKIATALQNKNLATVLSQNTEDAFRNAIKTYLNDSKLRHTRKKQGQEVVDAEGCSRISTEVLSLTDTNMKI